MFRIAVIVRMRRSHCFAVPPPDAVWLIAVQENYNEAEARGVCDCLLDALEYIHEQDFV